MALTGIHHMSFAVSDIDRTIDWCTNVLGGELKSVTNNVYDTLGEALFGTEWGVNQKRADLMIAVIDLAGQRIEFIEYRDPKDQALPWESLDHWCGPLGFQGRRHRGRAGSSRKPRRSVPLADQHLPREGE
jgi:catechol 2,3-dioxygenase-like lactoylglutathione lyase family enzyme